MSFIRSFSVNTQRNHPFPYSIPAVQMAKDISLDQPVTILVGDNGCGKSTLLECIAKQLDLPLIGGTMYDRSGFEAATILQPYLSIEWRRETTKGFFFRAEDLSDFINSIEREQARILGDLSELRGNVDDSIIDRMAESMSFSLRAMRRDYGDNMQAYSHGEAFLKIMHIRIKGKGIYLLDEPEAALSPLKQLSLLSLILQTCKESESQFIIATHSPIIMGLPDACLYQIQESGIEQVAFRETEHYSITKNFLDNPAQFLRYL